eukprot:Em0007g677a
MGSIGAILLRVFENRIRIALQAVHPDYHRMRLNGASRSLNPQPYQAAYFGEKLHIDQNEKLVMFGVICQHASEKPCTDISTLVQCSEAAAQTNVINTGKGIPNERMANARTRRLPSEIIPDAHIAISQFGDMGGHLTLESHLGMIHWLEGMA